MLDLSDEALIKGEKKKQKKKSALLLYSLGMCVFSLNS